MSREDSHRAPRHDRKIRHRPIPRAPQRRSAQGCAADRPVRRRLLLGIHRGGRGHGAHAPRRCLRRSKACAGSPPGKANISVATVERAQRGTTVQLQAEGRRRRVPEPERLRALIRKYSDHIAFPRDTMRRPGRRRRGRSTARKRCGRGRAPRSRTTSTSSSTSTLRTTPRSR